MRIGGKLPLDFHLTLSGSHPEGKISGRVKGKIIHVYLSFTLHERKFLGTNLGIVDKMREGGSAASLLGGVVEKRKPAACEMVQPEVQLMDRAKLCPILRPRSPVKESSLVLSLVKVHLYPQLHLRALPGYALPLPLRRKLDRL